MRSKIVFLLSLHHIEHRPDIDLSCSEKKQGQDVDINSRACSDQCPAQLQRVSKGCLTPLCRVAGLGRLSVGAKMAMKPFVKRVFTIFATNASFLRVISIF